MATSIETRYVELHPKSAERYAVSKGIFPNGVTHDARTLKPFPYYVTHSAGSHKWDVDGRRIIDYKTGHGSLILGHGHPDVVKAVTDQIGKGTHFSASTDLEISWGEWVRKLVPCAEKVRFHSSGTEADMMAMRMARAYTGKSKIIKFAQHFHGWSDYAVAGSIGIGGIPGETLSTMIVLPPNDISVVEETLKKQDDIAAVIIEPTGSHMGEIPIIPRFLEELSEVTRRFQVVLIFDEVVTGFRTSRGGAQEYYGVTPDVSTHAKILAGGLPGGAVTGKAEIIDMIQLREDQDFNRSQRIAHNGTFNANPISAVAGMTALEMIATTPVNDIANAMTDRLKNGVNDVLSRMEVSGCASGVASIMFLRLGVDHECDKEVCSMTADELHTADDDFRSQQLGLAMYNHGVDAWDRYILSAAHTEQDIDDTVEAIGNALIDIREAGLI